MTTLLRPRPVLRYHGGKWRLAPWIISHFPSHRIYTEVYGGAASVLLRKNRAYAEVYNDLDSEIVNVFQVLRNPAQAKDLANLLHLTPYARDEFACAYDQSDCVIEQARRTLVKSFMGFGADGITATWNTGFRSNTKGDNVPARDWSKFHAHISTFVDRLSGVVIENRPAIDVLRQHDSVDTLHYVDPPYVHATRAGCVKRKHSYRHEMTDADHRQLATVLHSLKGMVVLSGYPCDLYDRELYSKWERVEQPTYADGASMRIEVLWMNSAAIRERCEAAEAALCARLMPSVLSEHEGQLTIFDVQNVEDRGTANPEACHAAA